MTLETSYDNNEIRDYLASILSTFYTPNELERLEE